MKIPSIRALLRICHNAHVKAAKPNHIIRRAIHESLLLRVWKSPSDASFHGQPEASIMHPHRNCANIHEKKI